MLWGAAQIYANKHEAAVRRAGVEDGPGGLGESLFRRIVEGSSGVVLSEHEYEDTWSFMRTPDQRVRLAIPTLLAQVAELSSEQPVTSEAFPFVLQAGERRAWNANTIFRDPSWRPKDPDGALRIHPDDAARVGVGAGDAVAVVTARGEVRATVELNLDVLPGVVSLPHGYGLQHPDSGGERVQTGASINDLTDAAWVDALTKTPLHKTVPADVRAVSAMV